MITEIKIENLNNLKKGEIMMLNNFRMNRFDRGCWQKVLRKCKQSKIYYEEIENIEEELNLDFLSI